MTTHNHERLLSWLQDAYAMEQEAETMMAAMASRIEHYPELRTRIEQHIEETRQQASQVAACIEQLGGSLPTAKSTIAKGMAAIHAAGNAMMSDEVAKGIGISYAFEHMEIATYRALVVAARRVGQDEVERVCQAILEQEQAMADWLFERQPQLIEAFLEREQADLQAKR
ncbi:ferritin-like domain-containing protein [Luteimonas sp. MC1895]|uniref:ferritin-like domain-containing protein n=1 Tax=Luteimonas sp. MC1895 TaxID=2819513 RepID=UPI0018F0B7EB|nr:ferritin-like domain-containing protein [Luteimonas sp. MC1895]MBJ6979342.1 ferritin-like domain-containing protein [Luteimonas sp. MC1895]